MREFQKVCDNCNQSYVSDNRQPRIFPCPVGGVWVWLCPKCWDKQLKKQEEPATHE